MRFQPLIFLFLGGCSSMADKIDDPTERGLSYIASAIVVAAVIQAIFNK